MLYTLYRDAIFLFFEKKMMIQRRNIFNTIVNYA